MTRGVQDLVDRLRRLAAALAAYRRRVCEAVAGETSRLIAEAVRDVLTAALGGRAAAPEPPPWSRPSRPRPSWRDAEADPWGADSADTADAFAAYTSNGGVGRTAPDSDPAPRVPAAVAAVAAVARWWRSRRRPAWAGAGLGLLAGAAALLGGPTARTAIGLLAAAAELFS